MSQIRSIVDAHGASALAREVSAETGTECRPNDVSYWLRTGAVPSHFVAAVVAVVRRRGLITLDEASILALCRRPKQIRKSRKPAQGPDCDNSATLKVAS